MANTAESSHLVRFGDFELNLRTAELRTNGRHFVLPEKPFQILTALLERRGEMVSRDELSKRLWPEGTFVDFNLGLNKAVNRLREAIDDSAEQPRFIETFPKRGYRFVARISDVTDDQVIRSEPPDRRGLYVTARRWTLASGAAILVAALVAGGVHWRRSHQTTTLTERDTVILADFTNTTGDAVFDDTLKQGLEVQIEQSPFLLLVSDRRVNATLKLMGRPVGDRLTPEVTREVCLRTGGKAMLTGSIAALGNQYVIGLKAINCNTGDVLADAQEAAVGKEAVLKGLGTAALGVRRTLGESLSSVEKYATPLEEATTPSLEALKAFSVGQKTRFAKTDSDALPFFKRAIELDQNFALAHRSMSIVYINLNQPGRATESARKAYALREKVSERERFAIDATYFTHVTGELERASEVYQLWQQTYPRDFLPHGNLGVIYGNLGAWEKALAENREAVRLDPTNGADYSNLTRAYASLNRLDEAEAVYKQVDQLKLENEFLPLYRYQLAFLSGDSAGMARIVSASVGKPGTEDFLLAAQADSNTWCGSLKNARALTRRAMDSAQRNDATEAAALYQASAALSEAELGNRVQARADADAAVTLAPNRDVMMIAALALARLGDPAAIKLASKLDKTFPLDTLVQTYWLPTIRAAVELHRKDPIRAIEQLKIPGSIELGLPTNLTILMCPVYLRGEAYLQLNDGIAAAAEFQKFIDHRGLVMNFPWGALAHLGLARAYAVQGNTAKARSAYRDFLTLWKDADPEVPLLKEVKTEYAKLR